MEPPSRKVPHVKKEEKQEGVYLGKPIKKLKVDLHRADSALDHNDDLADYFASRSDVHALFLSAGGSK